MTDSGPGAKERLKIQARKVDTMQFVRYATDSGPSWGVTVDDQTYGLERLGEPTLEELATPGYRRQVARAVETGRCPRSRSRRICSRRCRLMTSTRSSASA